MTVALTDDYSFVLNDDGVILNTDSTDMPFVDIDKVSGFDSPEFRTTVRDHEGTDGGFMDAEFEKGRNLVLEGTIYATTDGMEDYLDSLKANWAPSSTLVPLYFLTPSAGQRLLYVKPLGVRYDWESMRRTGCVAAQFSAFAEDPRIYESALQTVTVAFGSTTVDGLGFPFGFPFGFGVTVETGPSTTIVNDGNRYTPGIITITGPVTNPRIINDTESATLSFAITLGASDTLRIDLANRTVRLNGTANRRGTLTEPNWFMFRPGSSFIRYQGTSGTGSFLTIEYRSAWR